jgi:hypothetical protein
MYNIFVVYTGMLLRSSYRIMPPMKLRVMILGNYEVYCFREAAFNIQTTKNSDILAGN